MKLKLILFITSVLVILSGFFGYKYISLRKLNNSFSWKSYENKEIKIKFSYPENYYIKSKQQKPSNSKHLYVYSDKNDKIIRIHYYPNSCEEKNDEFMIGSKNINGIAWQVKLFPKGLDSGDFTLGQPILYYITCQKGNKYSLQFNDRLILDSIQLKIINNFFILK